MQAVPSPVVVTDAEAIAFDTVPVSARRDGWSAVRQRAFVAALAETGSVRDAADRVGMSDSSAYRLRNRPGAAGFAAAWDAALALAAQRLLGLAFDLALRGSARGVWHGGERVGEERRPSERMLMFLLAHLDPMRFGRLSGLHTYQVRDPRVETERDFARLGDALTDLDPEPEPAASYFGGL